MSVSDSLVSFAKANAFCTAASIKKKNIFNGHLFVFLLQVLIEIQWLNVSTPP